MRLTNLFFFSPFLILFSHGLHAFAPSDLTGYKISLDIIQSSALSKGIRDFYFSSNVRATQYSGENGQWYPDTTTWTPSASIASKLVIGETNNSYADVFLNFQNASSGIFTFSYYDSEDGSPIQKLDEGSGTFTLSTFQSSDIPYDYYFSDDFSDLSKIQKLCNLTEFSLNPQPSVLLSPYVILFPIVYLQAAQETKHKMGPAADKIYLIHFNDVYKLEVSRASA